MMRNGEERLEIKKVEQLFSQKPNDLFRSMQENAFNHAPSNHQQNKLISQLFEECVEKHRDRIAVSFHAETISYAELNAKANKLANYLRKQGIGRNSLVAIYLESSIELIISIVAIIKAGGAFLPLSTTDPNNRIRRILQDSSPAKIITTSELKETFCEVLPVALEMNIVRINRFFEDKTQVEDSNPEHINSAEDLLYVMYTSGSTGSPKGCMVPHRCVARVVKDTNYIQFHQTDIVAQVANVAFDVLIFEMWGALFSGARLHIIPQMTLLSPVDFTQALKQYEISILCLTASLLNLLIKSCPDAFDNLRYLLFTGEKANPEMIKMLLKRKLKHKLPLTLINAYGPTECTTFAAAFMVDKMSDIQKNVPIGKPITDTTTYILDENLQFVGPGVLGELYLGGQGVTLGYLNDPKQTAKKFLNNPWQPGEKIYKTGDIAYWLDEVGIVYVGRSDSQVKINGFRIELSEIEATITKSRLVKQAVVVIQNEQEDRKKLVAYVSFYPLKESLDFVKFHQLLKNNIPYYMMPSEIIQVDHIPLTGSGKVDRKALSEMPGKNILENDVHHIISNWVEKTLVTVWQKLLGISSINITQNFFDLGAHSLMLNEACILINSMLSGKKRKKIEVIDILTYPSIEKLARYINKHEDENVNLLQDSIARATYQRSKVLTRKVPYESC